MARPFCIVFAGVNGAGKSTFYRTGLWREADMPQRMQRINPDEIVRKQNGNPNDVGDNLRAGREALKRIEQCFSKERSFNQETTLCGRTAVKNIERAHAIGYRVFLYYIGVDSVQTALDRIEHRVSLGGHDIDGAAVRRRYDASISNLARCLDYCEQVAVFDNTVDFASLALWAHGSLAWWGGGSLGGENWLSRAVLDDGLWRRA